MSFWPTLLSAGLNLAGNMYDAYRANNNDKDASNLDVNFAPYMHNINQIGDRGLEMITPDSTYNRKVDNQIKANTYDAQGVSNMLRDRNVAEGGGGSYSGIQSQWAQATQNKLNKDLYDKIELSRMNRENTGFGLIEKAAAGNQYMGELKTQRDLSKPQMNVGSLLSSGASGLLDAYLGQYESGGGQGISNVIPGMDFNSQLDDIFTSFDINPQGNQFSVSNQYSSGYTPNFNFGG